MLEVYKSGKLDDEKKSKSSGKDDVYIHVMRSRSL